MKERGAQRADFLAGFGLGPYAATIGDWTVHPYRTWVPEMSEEMLETLTSRTQEYGQAYPIMVDVEGRVLDGRAQLRACLALGRDPVTQVAAAGEPARVVADSIRRTDYTGAQRSLIAAKLLEPLRVEARNRQRNAGKPLPENFGKGEAPDLAAKAVGGTNSAYVLQAERVASDVPELLPFIADGRLPHMSHVSELALLEPKKRQAALRLISKGRDPALVLHGQRPTDDEWMTPEYLAIAIAGMFGGRIACDPCAPEGAKTFVNPEAAYTKADDGLTKDWPDRTFVNPPFSSVAKWVDHALRQCTLDPRKRMCFLLPIRPDSAHQERVLRAATQVLLLTDRIAFGKPGTQRKETGEISVMIVGLGGCLPSDLIDFGVEGVLFSPVGLDTEETNRWAVLNANQPPPEFTTFTDEEHADVAAWRLRHIAEAEALRLETSQRVSAVKPVKKQMHKPSGKPGTKTKRRAVTTSTEKSAKPRKSGTSR